MKKTEYRSTVLTGLARAAIARDLDIDYPPPTVKHSGWLQEPTATFVTLHKSGNLRGCIGTLEAYRPLIDDVQANAVAAAFRDPRFPPLSREEFHQINIEVSLLSSLEPMHVLSEAFAHAKLRRNRDGVVLKFGPHKATFLPQVWEQLPDPRQFLAHLKLKAGLPADFWDPEMLLFRYKVSKYREKARKAEE